MKVLCTGDLHIGRRPTRLPPEVDCRPLSCARHWDAIVDYAIAQAVDVVALSGDVVDQSNKFYEAVGPLERGLRRLGEAGVVTVAVAGNHDYDVLPQLASTLNSESFRLLGRGGEWKRTTISGRDGERLHVDGWSFPAEHVSDNPLATYHPESSDGVPVLGLLHADLDAKGSHYAPVSLPDLRACPVALWLLGHVHAPALHDGGGGHRPPVLYPGSPQAMDPGETGVHGVWLAEVRALTPVQPRSIPLASVRYATVDIDLTGLRELSELRTRITSELRSGIATLVGESGPLRHLSLRARVLGATALHRQMGSELSRISSDFEWQENGVTAHVERITAATRPERDLEALARGSDAVGLLARLARDVASGTLDTDRAALVRGAHDAAASLLDSSRYQAIVELRDDLDDRVLRARIEREAISLLDELLAQKEVV
jgi:DNA repair exonuclease